MIFSNKIILRVYLPEPGITLEHFKEFNNKEKNLSCSVTNLAVQNPADEICQIQCVLSSIIYIYFFYDDRYPCPKHANDPR